jgi:fatty acid-binding protein DegV
LRKLNATLPDGSSPFIMLEYTDNKKRVEEDILDKIKHAYPQAEIILQPLSLTTGVHTGPGTWGIAFLPENI